MIEILCSDAIDTVSLERPEAGPARIRVGTHHSLDAILSSVGASLSAAEASACHRLWADDGSIRRYRQTDEGMLFTLGDD